MSSDAGKAPAAARKPGGRRQRIIRTAPADPSTPLRIAGQTLLFTLFFGTAAVLSGGPIYRQLGPNEAELKISLRHSGARIGECRERDAAELAQLPENMRVAMECPRGRSPIHLQLDFNDARLVDETREAAGLHSDGRTVFYRRIRVPAGPARIEVRMNDDASVPGFTHTETFATHIAPEQALVIDFDPESGSFRIL